MVYISRKRKTQDAGNEHDAANVDRCQSTCVIAASSLPEWISAALPNSEATSHVAHEPSAAADNKTCSAAGWNAKHLTPDPWAPTSNDSFNGSATSAATRTLQSSPPVASRAEWKGENATALTSALWPWIQWERASAGSTLLV